MSFLGTFYIENPKVYFVLIWKYPGYNQYSLKLVLNFKHVLCYTTISSENQFKTLIGTESCIATPYRWTAPYEADEAYAGIKLSRQPQNEWAGSSEGTLCSASSFYGWRNPYPGPRRNLLNVPRLSSITLTLSLKVLLSLSGVNSLSTDSSIKTQNKQTQGGKAKWKICYLKDLQIAIVLGIHLSNSSPKKNRFLYSRTSQSLTWVYTEHWVYSFSIHLGNLEN